MTKNIKELEQEEEELSLAVRSSAQQIWQAGLGAFAKAQQEGGRAGGREFTRLVRGGSELQKRARQVEDATDTVARKAERSSRRASGTWGKLEQVFEERVARALATIGVPARSEMEALNHRIDELERMLAELAGEQMRRAADKAVAAAPKRAAAKPASARPAAKAAVKAAVKPAASKRAAPARKAGA